MKHYNNVSKVKAARCRGGLKTSICPSSVFLLLTAVSMQNSQYRFRLANESEVGFVFIGCSIRWFISQYQWQEQNEPAPLLQDPIIHCREMPMLVLNFRYHDYWAVATSLAGYINPMKLFVVPMLICERLQLCPSLYTFCNRLHVIGAFHRKFRLYKHTREKENTKYKENLGHREFSSKGYQKYFSKEIYLP